jgi:hypothetical protein
MQLSTKEWPRTDLVTFTKKLQSAFSYYGFITPPLKVCEIHLLHAEGFSENTCYAIGCDLASMAFNNLQKAIEYYHEARNESLS